MKKFAILMLVWLISPALLHAETSYFVLCRDTDIMISSHGFQGQSEESRSFKKGTVFEVSKEREDCHADPAITGCTLKIHCGNRIEGNATWFMFGHVDSELGCWFKSQSAIATKDEIDALSYNATRFMTKMLKTSRVVLFEKQLDSQIVDVMCSEHPAQF